MDTKVKEISGVRINGTPTEEAYSFKCTPTFDRPNGTKRTIGFGLRCTRDVDNMAQLTEQSMEILNQALDTEEVKDALADHGLELELYDTQG